MFHFWGMANPPPGCFLAISLVFQICFQKLNKHYFLYLGIWLLISGDILEPCKAEIWSWHWLGMKRKVEGEEPEDGQRTIRRKARENKKTQQWMWFSMKKINFEVQFVLFICCIVYLTLMTDYLGLIGLRLMLRRKGLWMWRLFQYSVNYWWPNQHENIYSITILFLSI